MKDMIGGYIKFYVRYKLITGKDFKQCNALINMKKKAQVSIFVIIAILIIAGILLLVYMKKESFSITPAVPTEVQPVYNFVQDCLKKTGENALIRVGEQGGYFLIMQDVDSIDGRIPYYAIQSKNLILPKEQIEMQISSFVYEELSFCILNFKDIRDKFDITSELKKADTKILDNSVKIVLDYPVSASKKESKIVHQFKSFEIEIPVRLDKAYKASQEIIAEQIQHPESICLSCLYDTGNKYEMHVDMLDYGNSTIFTLIDDSSKINEESYEWSFAIK